MARWKKFTVHLLLNHDPVVQGDPRILKSQGLDELVLIYANLRKPDVSDL